MISYESSKWYVKLWRQRWYIYAIFLHIKNFINIYIFIDLLLEKKISGDEKDNLRSEWKDIIKHVELSKMNKFSQKNNYVRKK